jgi:Fe-S-cluster-containing dehydrogenase component
MEKEPVVDGMEKVLIVDIDKCTGCRVCELACSMANTSAYDPHKSNIRVLKNKDMDINMIVLSVKCEACESCVKACLPGAIRFVDFHDAVLHWKAVKVGSMPAPLVGSLH